MSFSVIVTVYNEAKHIRDLLDSLIGQADLHEVIIIDAASTDQTVARAQHYADRLPLKIHVEPCSRGAGRNTGAAMATGEYLAFIDGDCMANSRWLLKAAEVRAPNTVVAGKTKVIGYWAFTKLHRVELPHKGQDTTWPSCNLVYPKALFDQLGGFDESLVTAEDIDLNYRAVESGATINSTDAIVYARARDSITGFLRQAYWNGFGRKQLTKKHGGLWHEYRIGDMIRMQASFWGLLRMGFGLWGYLDAKLGRKPPHP